MGLGARSDDGLRAFAALNVIGVIRGRGERILEANDAFLRMLGYERADLEAGRMRWPALTPPVWTDADARATTELATEGRFEPFVKEYLAADGSRVPVMIGGSLVAEADDEWMCFVVDLTRQHEAERERERLLDRTQRLQAVTERLSAALTPAEVADVVVTHSMAATGACCGVLGTSHLGVLRVDHKFGLADDAPGRLPLDLEAPMPLAVRRARPVLVGSRDEWLARWPATPPRTEFEAFAAVPLVFEGTARGCMGLGFPDPRPFESDDVALLEALARQAAQALERARLYEEREYVARTLQEGLLPDRLPSIPGLDTALRYRPLPDGGQVGGDFYDLVQTGAGRWLATIGDVCGKGTGAAVLAGTLRTTAGAVSLRDDDPRAVLGFVDEVVRRQHPGALASMAIAALRRVDDRFSIVVAAAGHPPPLVLRAGGELEVLGAGGRLIGIGPDLMLEPATALLAAGDVLLLYTDGVTDARGPGGELFGEARLHGELRRLQAATAVEVAAAVEVAVNAFGPAQQRDDMAVMALRVAG